MAVVSVKPVQTCNMKKDKAITYDHTGDISGMWTIDGKKAREEFGDSRYWEGVDEIVRLFKELHPAEYDATITATVKERLNNNNEYGSNKGNSFRKALEIPHGLYLALTDYDQRIFRNKKTRTEFMKRFNELRACDTV